MRFATRTFVAASLAFTAHAAEAVSCESDSLRHWPPAAAEALDKMIAEKAHQGHFAVFDADNTIWKHDIEEASIPYLENIGVLTRDNLDPALKVVDFKDTPDYTESLYSYYNRLCEIDPNVGYPWAAQVYSGLTLRQLKGHIDDMLAMDGTIPTTYWDGDAVLHKEVHPPKIYTGQKELINKLQKNGIKVHLVSAANEEVVRMVASDPQYGLNVDPRNVIGVGIILRNGTSGAITASRKQVTEGTYNQEDNLDLKFTSELWSPATWYAGKWAAVLTYIDQWKKPILAAGDTPGSDTYMVFNADVEHGGQHLWIKRSAAVYASLQDFIAESVAGQQKNDLPITVDKNWIVVQPSEIE